MQNEFAGQLAKEAHSDWFENAVLVYGPRKSGTTLLHNLLDGGDELFVYPEELKLKRLLRDKVESKHGAALYRKRSRIPLGQLPRFDIARYDAAWSAEVQKADSKPLKARVRDDVRFVMEAIVGRKPAAPQAWCAKEVGGNANAIIGWWLKNFARPRVIFIVRDPRMVTRAVLNDRRRKERALSFSQIVRETFDPIRVLLAQKDMMKRAEILTISYESLVSDPAGTMRMIAAFLHVPYGPHFETPTIFGDPVVVRTASQSSAGVFESNARWHDGLTLREKLIVGAISVLARIVPNWRLNYGKLASDLKPARASA